MSVAALIAANRTQVGIPHAVSCRLMGVSESWFYKWRARSPTLAELRRRDLDKAVLASFVASDGTYGSPRVAEELRDDGWAVSTNTVAASMRRQALTARPQRRARRALRRPEAAAATPADLLGRDFAASSPNEKWCGDFKQVPTAEGPVHLAAVVDLYSRRLVGFALSDHHPTAALAVDAICMATAIRGGDVAGVIFHTDRGSPYGARRFGETCKRLGITQSMGQPGSALDNAPVESFFATLQKELLHRRHYRTRTEARHDIAAWIDGWYNPRRRHSSLDNTSPINYENDHPRRHTN